MPGAEPSGTGGCHSKRFGVIVALSPLVHVPRAEVKAEVHAEADEEDGERNNESTEDEHG